jgi:hypothetical protein
MPVRLWRHGCGCHPTLQLAERCYSCRGAGEDLGWRMTRVEKAEAFANATGLLVDEPPSAGRDRELARLLTCPLCDGEGLLQGADPDDGWAPCPQCDGTGTSSNQDFGYNRFMTEIGSGECQRLCDTRYSGNRSWRHENGALHADELEALRERLADVLPDEATLIPAVRDRGARRVAVGPTHTRIIEWIWRPRFTWGDEIRTISGFIELERGYFLDPGNALRRAPEADLVLRTNGMWLRAEWLRYHGSVPFLIVRGQGSGGSSGR